MVFVAHNSRIRIVGVEMIRFRQNRNYTAAAERIPERQNLHRILWSEPQKWCAPPDSKPTLWQNLELHRRDILILDPCGRGLLCKTTKFLFTFFLFLFYTFFKSANPLPKTWLCKRSLMKFLRSEAPLWTCFSFTLPSMESVFSAHNQKIFHRIFAKILIFFFIFGTY